MKCNFKRILTLLVAVLMLVSLFGCTAAETQTPPAASAAPAPAVSTAPAGNTDAPPATGAETVEVVDNAGRTITVPTPENLKRVYPVATDSFVMYYTIAADLIDASCTQFSEDDAPYVVPNVINVPSYGTLSGSNGVLDYEAIKAGDVQLLLYGYSNLDQSDIDYCNELQEQLGIPVAIVHESFDGMPEGYRLLGQLLGREERAEELIAYFQGIVKEVTDFVATIPEEDRMTLYYAEGADGLATEAATSPRSVVFNTAGAINIATVEVLSGFGQSGVSLEQVLAWNPDVIVVQGYSGAYDIITTDPDWANITAVKNGMVVTMPTSPFNWADRPPSVNRFIGLLWMTKVLYGDRFDIDLVARAIDYYKVVYSVDVSEADMQALLTTSMPQG